jgi:flagellar biogenesis protein FliO
MCQTRPLYALLLCLTISGLAPTAAMSSDFENDSTTAPPPQTRPAPYPYPAPPLTLEPVPENGDINGETETETETDSDSETDSGISPDFLRAVQDEFDRAAAPQEPGATAPPRTTDRDWGYYVIRGLFGLCVACAGVLLLGYLARKYGRKNPLLAGRHLGTVLGRVHLSPRASLHYVHSGNRVLVIGLTQNTIAPITEFDAADFDTQSEPGEKQGDANQAPDAVSFLQLLKNETEENSEATSTLAADEELAALRGDLQRLRQYLQEKPGESNQ